MPVMDAGSRGPDGWICSADALSLLFSAATATPTDDERRYARGSVLLLVLLGAGLVGFALLLP